MYNEKRIFCIIPARHGSKRLALKNIYPVLGKPMIRWTIDEVKKSKYIDFDKVYVSTDSSIIKDVCKDVNIIDRPAKLAEDNVWTQDVVNHFISTKGIRDDDIIVILQANSPQIKHDIIDFCIEKLIDNDLWQVHTVDQNYINNGAIHVYIANVKNHYGKVNYNGVIKTNWIDVHYEEDVIEVEKEILKKH